MRTNKLFIFLLLAFFLTEWLPENAGGETPPALKKPRPEIALPEIMSWTTYDVGSSGYVQAAAIGDAFTRKKGIKLRVLPAGTDISRAMPLKMGVADFSLAGIGCYFAWQGIHDFASFEWGPQQLRQVWQVLPNGMPAATAADAQIKTPRHLKGKRVAWIPGNPSINIAHEAFMAFAGYTWNDVQKVIFPSFGSAGKGLIENTNDVMMCTGTSAFLYELEASRRGLYWPEFPASDKEGWARLSKVAPYFFPDLIAEGPGIAKDHPRELPNYAYPALVCYPNKDENVVYALAKAIYETYDVYKNVNLSMKGWEMKKAIRPPGMVPYHKGSIRFFMEVGVWSRELDEWNNKALESEKEIMNAWAKAKKEAIEKRVPAKDFSKSWMRSRGVTVD